MESEELIMMYVSVWGWHIMGIIFLVSSLIIFFSGSNLGNTIFFFAFLVCCLVSELMAYRRKGQLELEEEETKDEKEGGYNYGYHYK